MDEEKYISWRASYRFIRIPVNQKVFYDSHVKERAAAELLNSEHSHSHGQFMALENTKTDFTDLVTFDVESGLQELPEHLLHQTNIKTFNEDEETLSLDVLKSNIQQVLANFNQKEIYIEHPFGLNGEFVISEEIAANLKVTKHNIHKDQNYPDVKTQFT
jgi:hypothetical protein